MLKYILVVSAVYPPEPVVSARLSEDIYQTIKKEGIGIKVLHPRATRPNGYHFNETIKIGPDEVVLNSYTCPKSSLFGRFRESYSFGKATYSYLKRHQHEINVLYANTWPLFAQLLLARAAKKFGIPYYIHIHDIYPESYCYKMPRLLGAMLLKVFKPLDRYVLKNSKGVICISPSMISYLSKSRKISASKFTLVRNWQNDKEYIDAYKPVIKKGEGFHVMYLGSINPTANVQLIIKACAEVDRLNFRLSIIGNGPEKENCVVLAKRLGVPALFDTVMPEQVAERQRMADVLVLCLKSGVAHTATPSKLTAYMLTGRPIVASVDLDSDCANIIRESQCGIVVEPDNELALREALQMMSKKSVEESNKMGKSAYDYAVLHLSKEKNLRIITDLIAKNKND